MIKKEAALKKKLLNPEESTRAGLFKYNWTRRRGAALHVTIGRKVQCMWRPF